jgi:hypothetical protein
MSTNNRSCHGAEPPDKRRFSFLLEPSRETSPPPNGGKIREQERANLQCRRLLEDADRTSENNYYFLCAQPCIAIVFFILRESLFYFLFGHESLTIIASKKQVIFFLLCLAMTNNKIMINIRHPKNNLPSIDSAFRFMPMPDHPEVDA